MSPELAMVLVQFVGSLVQYHAENKSREEQGYAPAYGAEEFRDLTDATIGDLKRLTQEKS